MRNLWIALALAAALMLPAAARSDKVIDPKETGRQYTTWFYGGEADRLWELFSPEMKKALGSVEKLKEFRAQIQEQAGTETDILDEKVIPSQGLRVYVRKARFSKVPTPVVVQWALTDEGIVAGFFVQPEQPGKKP